MDRVEKALRGHSSVKELQEKDSDLLFSRAIFDIPKPHASNNFTVGTLSSPTTFSDPPAVLVSTKLQTVTAVYYLGEGLSGHPGFAHGGVIATIMDECCGRAALCYFEGETETSADSNGEEKKRSHAVTVQLSVNYKAPTPLDSLVLVQATLEPDSAEGRKASPKARMWSLKSPDSEATADNLVAEATSLFVNPAR